ncbi:hypothetical protein LSH36_910g00009 [Paralvinella palmiformis]|uniref:Uncharacterized protein n=1 Tax=Paralvinella palmiformis TaxID=53620 RepID=A0AAD9IYR4_9ANNE|nr:hypothetical protein LSH36_910g00009 [Paralvinella palmiformis]
MISHGVEVNSVMMEIRLPKNKICLKAKNQLFQLKQSKKTTLRALQSIIVPGRPFLRRMIGLICGLPNSHHHIRLNKEARTDSEAWLGFLYNFNGRTILQ